MNPSVTLLACTPEPIKLMAAAARLCYSRDIGIADLRESLDQEASERLLLRCLASGHHSVLEHVSLTFGIEGVSRNASHQLVRHRNTSYSEQSRHYTVQRQPPAIAQPDCPEFVTFAARWREAVTRAHDLYVEMVDAGVPRQDARHILPGGMETKLVETANLRQWLRFVELRVCSLNCAEALLVARAIRHELVTLMPFLAGHAGPSCLIGSCKEGARCCGKPWKVPEYIWRQ